MGADAAIQLLGEDGLPEGWRFRRFGDLLDNGTRNGIYKAKEFRSHGAKMVNMGELFAYPRLGDVDMARIEVTENEYGKFGLRCGDLLFARRSLVAEGAGKCCLVCGVSEPTVFESSIIRARLDPNEGDSRFFYYLFGSALGRHLRDSILRQTAVSGITGSDLVELIVPVAPSGEQAAIADFLERLDDMVELNRRMNETLEATARVVFRSWFVDFDPVVAKVDGCKPCGMSAETAARFPEHFEESELDPIPLGWSRGTIAEIAEYVNGRNFTKNATGTGRMVIRIAELNSGPGASTVYNDVEADSVNTAYPDDILFAWSGSLDVYRWHRDEALINQHIFKVVCDEYPKWFVHMQLQEAIPFFQGIAADKATTMGHVKRHHLSEADLTIPPQPLMDHATAVIQPLFDRIHTNERESMSLTAIRDTLLPKLLSGEIRLRDAERAVEEVV